MLTFQRETFGALWPEAEPLMLLHWEEVGADRAKARFRLDVPTFQFLDLSGGLQVLTARRAGAIVGYSMVVIRPHLHYDLLCGFEDAYYLAPEERKGRTGIRLIQKTLEELKRRGVQKVFFHSKTVRPVGKIFERLGFTKSDEIYSIWLED